LLELGKNSFDRTEIEEDRRSEMRIAIPLVQGKLSLHFGHCEQFAIIDVDDKSHEITKREDLAPPAHEPGVLPRWLHEMGVNVIIAGGMGQKAQQLFAQNDIDVVVGAPDNTPEELAAQYMAGQLSCGENICDH
jgi:predicted Fe-Mo cluster-binding NifX family protein